MWWGRWWAQHVCQICQCIPRSACACKCCLRMYTVHSINNWCTISSTTCIGEISLACCESECQSFPRQRKLQQGDIHKCKAGDLSSVNPHHKQLRKHNSLHWKQSRGGSTLILIRCACVLKADERLASRRRGVYRWIWGGNIHLNRIIIQVFSEVSCMLFFIFIHFLPHWLDFNL